MAPRVVVSCPLPGRAIELLEASAEVTVLGDGKSPLPESRLRAELATADAFLSMLTDRVSRDVLEGAQGLRVVGNCAVGFDNIDVGAATELGVQICNTPNVLTEATADLAWALLLAAARRIPEADRFVRSGAFQRFRIDLFLGAGVHGKTLGIVGLGRIGRAVARRARGFDQRLLYTQRRRLPPEEEGALGVEHAPLDELLRQSDFVSLHAPLSPETRHLVGARELALMKTGAVLVNTARGPLVDEAALAEALTRGSLGAAALDVYEDEPHVHPALLTLQNVVLTPHIGSATAETRSRMAEAVAADIVRVLSGEEPVSPVNAPPKRRSRSAG